MKSKLLKLKEKFGKMTSSDWCFVSMYVFGSLAVGYCIAKMDLFGLFLSLSYVIAVDGWRRSVVKGKKIEAVADIALEHNEKLTCINDELKEQFDHQLLISQGLISENKDLKLKLKNAKMENSRIRKGGKKNE